MAMLPMLLQDGAGGAGVDQTRCIKMALVPSQTSPSGLSERRTLSDYCST